MVGTCPAPGRRHPRPAVPAAYQRVWYDGRPRLSGMRRFHARVRAPPTPVVSRALCMSSGAFLAGLTPWVGKARKRTVRRPPRVVAASSLNLATIRPVRPLPADVAEDEAGIREGPVGGGWCAPGTE